MDPTERVWDISTADLGPKEPTARKQPTHTPQRLPYYPLALEGWAARATLLALLSNSVPQDSEHERHLQQCGGEGGGERLPSRVGVGRAPLKIAPNAACGPNVWAIPKI